MDTGVNEGIYLCVFVCGCMYVRMSTAGAPHITYTLTYMYIYYIIILYYIILYYIILYIYIYIYIDIYIDVGVYIIEPIFSLKEATTV
jgi:hypothetical protein